MKISAKAEYACLAVLALARSRPESSSVHIREISREYGIPERYLVQILLQLKGAGLVASTRGAGGDIAWRARLPSISLSEILLAVDGPDDARRGTSDDEGPGRCRSDTRLGEHPGRGTRRARPHDHRTARRTVISPRVDHLNPNQMDSEVRLPFDHFERRPTIPSTSKTPVSGGESRDRLEPLEA